MFAIVVILLACGLYYFFAPAKGSLSTSQKNTALEKILGRDVRHGDNIKVGYKKYNGKYLTFDYPAAAEEYTYNREKILGTKFVLDDFQLQQLGGPKYFLNAMVQDASIAATLEDLTGVNSRENSHDYTKNLRTIAHMQAVVFTKDNTDGAEDSVFFGSKDKYFTMIISGSQLSEIAPVFERILSSIVLK